MAQNTYYSLGKALYGLHQAPLTLFKKVREVSVSKLGYKQLHSDGAVFIRRQQEGNNFMISIVLVYVDDILFVCNSDSAAEGASREFLNYFEG